VLKKMLEHGGLDETDYTLAAVGGDTARLAALKAGEIAGALLLNDFATQAAASGMHTLAKSLDVLNDYQGTCLFTRRKWAASHRDELVRFVGAVRDAHDWIFDPANNSELAAMLPPGVAATAVKALTAARGGLSRDGALDINGLKVVLSLRSQYGAPKRELHDPTAYFDSSYLTLAYAKPCAARSQALETRE
jgi:ABC-type nitrate/sulfonate/bicarbonate transport system substrate-binding protein